MNSSLYGMQSRGMSWIHRCIGVRCIQWLYAPYTYNLFKFDIINLLLWTDNEFIALFRLYKIMNLI